MRRPRRRLEVSTFPFLAVLLCAMGSLILLLLVLDRRAKAVARARAEDAVRVARAERDAAARAAAEAAAERAAERERRRAALHDQLTRARDEVAGQLRTVEERKATAIRTTAAQRERWRELLEVLGSQREELTRAERDAAAARGTAAEERQMSESARREAERLSAQLRGLEVVLNELKAARQREAHTYSLLPYTGKRGDGRRPLYVECAAHGLVFYPDRKVLSRVATPHDIREEVQARVERQRASVLAKGGEPDKRAYLLMLVRPDGIPTYYHAMAALQGRDVDFGYEFIDADWVLDFPEDDTAPPSQPWMTAQRIAVAPADPSTPTRKVSGLRTGKGDEVAVDDLSGTAEGTPGAGRGSSAARGGPAGLPPLPGARRGEGATGGGSSGLPPLPGPSGGGGTAPTGGAPAAGGGSATVGLPPLGGPSQSQAAGVRQSVQGGASAGVTPGVAWGPVASAPPGATSGAGLPPLPGAPGGGSGQGTGSLSKPGGSSGPGPSSPGQSPLPSKIAVAGGTGVPDPDGTLPGSGPRSPGASRAGAPSGGGPAVPGAGAGGTGGAPPALPFDRTMPSRATAGGQAGGAPGGDGQPPGAVAAAAGASAPRRAAGPAGGQPHDPDEPQGPHLGAGMLPGEGRPPAPGPSRPLRLLGNRDWIIPAECRADGVVLRNAGQRFPTAALSGAAAVDSPLQEALRQMIARRQATVRPGEPPYRPQLRLLVYPDGLRTYYLACAVLEPLGIPLTRQNVDADSPARPAP